MAQCTACTRQLLTLFIREATGLETGSLRSSTNLRQLSNQRLRRSYSTTSSFQHRASSRNQSSLASIAPNSVSDDVYVPFEKLAIAETSHAGMNPVLPVSFEPPPPPPYVESFENDEVLLEHQSEYEPEIELNGALAGSNIGSTLLKEAETRQNGTARLEQTEDELHLGLSPKESVLPAAMEKEETKAIGIAAKPKFLGKRSLSREARQERLAKWKEARPPPAPKQATAKSMKSSTKKVAVTPQSGHTAPVIRKTIAFSRTTKEDKPRTRFEGTKSEEPWTSTLDREQWMVDKAALKAKFGDEAWNPRKKLSPDALEGIRTLHAQHPEQFTTPVLADHFKVSPEVIRRILKSKWRASAEEEESRRERWDKRGERIWAALVDSGVHAPKKWREMGIGGGPRRKAQGNASIWKSSRDGKSETAGKAAGSGSAWVDSLAERLL